MSREVKKELSTKVKKGGGRIKDLTGLVFGYLTVVRYIHTKEKGAYWICQCQCGREVTVKGSNMIRGSTKSCGCWTKSNREDVTGRRFGMLLVTETIQAPRTKTLLRCLCDCGKESIKSENKVKMGTTMSCGCVQYEGFSKYWNRKHDEKQSYVGQTFNHWTVLEIIKRDSQTWLCRCSCGVEKRVSQTAILIGTSKSCGCQRPVGDQVYNWNPNLTDEERQERRDFRGYDEWHRGVLKRDNYTCQVSGERGGRLAVHHLYSWASHKELRVDPTNGITMKENLHNLFHRLYGKGKNTPEQYHEFVRVYRAGEFDTQLRRSPTISPTTP